MHRTYAAAGRLTVDQQILSGLPGGSRSVNYFYGDAGQSGRACTLRAIRYSRSVAAVAANLLMSGKVKTAEEAFAMIRRVRPSVVIRAEVLYALSEFEHRVRSSFGGNDSFVLASDHGALS